MSLLDIAGMMGVNYCQCPARGHGKCGQKTTVMGLAERGHVSTVILPHTLKSKMFRKGLAAALLVHLQAGSVGIAVVWCTGPDNASCVLTGAIIGPRNIQGEST